MRRLADALALDEGSFDIRSNKGGPAVSGEVTLHGEDVWVQLSLGLSGPDREVCFRSEEHTSELQSLMRISYAVLCLQQKHQQHFKANANKHKHILCTRTIAN